MIFGRKKQEKKDKGPGPGGRAEPKKSLKRKIYEGVETSETATRIVLIIRFLFIQAYKIPTGSMEPTLLGSEASLNHSRGWGDHLLVEKITYGIPLFIPFTDNLIVRLPAIRKIRHGDIVVFKYPHDPKKDYIKRVIGLPGDEIQIKNKKVYINKKKLDEPWLKYGKKHFTSKYLESGEESPRDNFGPIIIPKEGDNIRFMNDRIYINDKFIYNKKIISMYSREVTGEYFKLYEKSITPSGENKYIAKYDCYFVMGDNRDNSSDSRYWGFLPCKYISGKPLVKYLPFTRMGLIK